MKAPGLELPQMEMSPTGATGQLGSPVDGHDGRIDTASQLLGSLLSQRRGVFDQDGVGDMPSQRRPASMDRLPVDRQQGEAGNRRHTGRVWNSSYSERRHRQRFQGGRCRRQAATSSTR
jgi:hypothetical protein